MLVELDIHPTGQRFPQLVERWSICDSRACRCPHAWLGVEIHHGVRHGRGGAP